MTIWYKQLTFYHRVLCAITAFVSLGSQSTAIAEEIFPTREFNESASRKHYSQLLNEYGAKKELPPDFELQTLIALSHFPELKDISIRFVVANVGIPLSSRPHWLSMLRSADKRIYQVIIDNDTTGSREALLLKNQPFNAQIGIIGHELSHTVYYLERSFFEILNDALCQFSDCRIGFERATDKRLVSHGLGWQRYDHALFVRTRLSSNSEAAPNTEGGGSAYMSPNELLSTMGNTPGYDLNSIQTD